MISGLVSVVIPSRDRPERLSKALKSLHKTSPGVEVVLVLPTGQNAVQSILDGFKRHLVVELDDHEQLNTAELWNAGAAASSGEFIVTGADDLVFQPGWLKPALLQMQTLGNSGVVALNTGPEFKTLPTHVMVARKYAARRLGGVIFTPHYPHGWVDVELMWRAVADGAMRWSEASVIHHEHPFFGAAEMDPVYEKGQSRYEEERALFDERKANKFPDDFEPVIDWQPEWTEGWGKIAIGVRSYKFPHPMFFDSWTWFILGGLEMGDRILRPEHSKPGQIAANDLVRSFLSTDCDALLFIDDDMTFNKDVLGKIRNNTENYNYDVVMGFATFKSVPPHAIVYDLDKEQPGVPESLRGAHYSARAHIDDNSVTEVDAVGLGFTLVKRHVFEQMLSEHGPDYTAWFTFGELGEGEDVRFSQKARELGFRLAVDTNAHIGHAGTQVFGWNEHQQFIKQLEKQNNG